MNIAPLDLVIIVAYMICITGIGIWVGYRKNATSEEYFLAGKSLGWFSIGSALFASNISTIHLVGLSAAGASVGIVMGNFEWMASFCLIILAMFFAPIYFRSGIQTLPEYLERRYSTSARTFLAAIAIFGALLIHIGISLFAGAKLFEAFLGVPVTWSIVIISAVTVLYTVLGGLRAVVITETIQTFLLLAGAVLITVLGIFELPEVGIKSFTEFKEVLAPDQMNMVHSIYDADGNLNPFSWLAILFGFPVLGIWYWCTDQTIVQRVLGAKSERDAQNGALFAGLLKILPVFLMVFPGVIAFVLVKQGAMSFGVLADGTPDFNNALPALINKLIPIGLKGLLAAGLLAALMSTIAAALNSCATLISVDIVKRINPNLGDAKEVNIGRVSTGVIMILAMLWSTQGGQFGTIFEAINKIPMIFAPAVTTVFVLGVFWRRGTNTAALSTFAIGCTVGLVYFVMDMKFVGKMFLTDPPLEFAGLISDNKLGLGIPFMLVGPILCSLCIATYVVVSLNSKAPSEEQLANSCWGSPAKAFAKKEKLGFGDPRINAALLAIAMVVLYVIFR